MRAKRFPLRQLTPEPRYNSTEVTKLINRVMKNGKKSLAAKHVYDAFELVEKELKTKPLEAFLTALDNIKPKTEVRSRRVGGAAYQVPMPVPPRRQFALSIRWLVENASKRPNSEYKSFAKKLAAEIIAAYNQEGGAIKKRDDVHRMAEANKAFAHFRW